MPPYLLREIGRLLRRYAVIEELIAEVELDCQMAIVEPASPFPEKEKVQRLATLGGVGPTSALLLVAEVYHRRFDTRRHLASFIGLAPLPTRAAMSAGIAASTRLGQSSHDRRWSSWPGRGCAINPRARCRSGGGNGSPVPACAAARLALSRSPGDWRSRFGSFSRTASYRRGQP